MHTSPRPIVLFAFANDREDPDLYLRNLPEDVPKFFARLKGVARGDAQTYITAWRAYRGCLDRER
ncbi:MAG TPA: hypothetical protein VH988_01425 [Thermoanaerobaculia bacterium]|jgi:ABC-type uncharacterized transport system ATPase subunit|nr:hypothetical protein [Thermoanaerobaculia bacterium]